MTVSNRLRTVLVLFALLSFARGALAQTSSLGDAKAADERAAARATATEGLRAMKEERWADAMTLFERAEALVHAPPHLLYYARASVKLGKLVQANEAYVKILRETLPPTAPRAFLDAQAEAAGEQPKVEQSLPHLKIVVEGKNAKDARVTVNGVEVPRALVGISAPHDPGDLTIDAVAPGWRSRPEKITLQEGEQQTVKLTLNISDATAMPPIESVQPPAPKMGLRVAGWITVALGAGGLGAGTYFLIDNRNNRQAANALCTLPNDVCPSAQRSTIQAYDSAANTSEVLSWIGYGVGGAAVVMGVVMVVLSRGGSEPSTEPKAATVRPWFGIGTVGLSGSF